MPQHVDRDEREFTRTEARILNAWSRITMSGGFLLDLAIVVGMALTHVPALLISPAPSGPWWWPLLISVPALSTLLLRRRHPWMGLVALLIAIMPLMYPDDIHLGPLNLALLVAMYSITVRTGRVGLIVAVALYLLYPLARLVIFEWPFAEGLLMTLTESIELVMVLGWGLAVRTNRQRSAQLQQTVGMLDKARGQLVAEAAAIERARLAREFHDIASHNLAVVTQRSADARRLVGRDPVHVRDTLTELEDRSRSALGEMRQLLGALRDGGDTDDSDPTPGADDEEQRRPTPTLDWLDSLLESVRGSGLVWHLDRRGTVRELGQGVDLTAYRIVQEAVTNVLKHARTGRAVVVLDYRESSLTITVTNKVVGPLQAPPGPEPARATGPTTAQPSKPSGHGLVGLRERVAVLGGTLTAHPITNGFHLEANLPYAPTSTSATP